MVGLVHRGCVAARSAGNSRLDGDHRIRRGEKFIANRFNYLYITDKGHFIGAISWHDIKNYLDAPELAELVIAGDILREDIPLIHPSASLNEALERFARHLGERLPVVTNHEGSRLVGSLAKTDVILALAGSARPRPQPHPPAQPHA